MAHRLEFSEFTFGFALTENFGRQTSLKAVPVFPSLIEEGTQTGGYDVAIDDGNGLPLLLQFKVPQVVNRRSANIPVGFPCPYYRAHLRCRVNDEGYSQHSVLLQHERNGYEVYYATPRFHQISALDELFAVGNVVNESAFFRPSDVGDLSDEAHHVAYCAQSDEGWLRSEPAKLPHPISADTFLRRLERALPPAKLRRFEFSALLDSMVRAAEFGVARAKEREGRRNAERSDVDAELVARRRLPPREFAARIHDGRSSKETAALFARLWLNAELLVVSRD
jgi:hypothetical protein